MTDSHVSVLLLTALVAGIASAALIVAILPLLKRYALARPNARSSHVVPTPQGAGIAVIAATLAVAAAVLLRTSGIQPVAASLFASTILIAALGVVDDLKPIPVLPRLAGEIIAIAAVLAFLPPDTRALPLLPLPAERAVELIAGLWFVNLVNFMDGIDWITAAEVVPITAALGVLAWLGHLSPTAAIVAAALGGATLGFAPFNKPVARVFLGDVGSLPIGLLLGWLMLMLAGQGYLAAALLLPLYYLADATVTLARRIARREKIWEAHRSHFYQRATARGFTVTEVIGRVLLVNASLVLLALISVVEPDPLVDIPLLMLGTAFVAWLLITLARGKR